MRRREENISFAEGHITTMDTQSTVSNDTTPTAAAEDRRTECGPGGPRFGGMMGLRRTSARLRILACVRGSRQKRHRGLRRI